MHPRATIVSLFAIGLSLLPAAQLRAQQSLSAATAAVAAAAEGSLEQIRAKLGEAAALLGHDLPAACSAARQAQRWAIERGDALSAMRAGIVEARAISKLQGHDAAVARMNAAEFAAPPSDGARAELLLARASIDWMHDEIADALSSLRAALESAIDAEDEQLEVRCELMAMNVIGLPENAFDALTRLEGICRSHGDLRGNSRPAC